MYSTYIMSLAKAPICYVVTYFGLKALKSNTPINDDELNPHIPLFAICAFTMYQSEFASIISYGYDICMCNKQLIVLDEENAIIKDGRVNTAESNDELYNCSHEENFNSYITDI